MDGREMEHGFSVEMKPRAHISGIFLLPMVSYSPLMRARD